VGQGAVSCESNAKSDDAEQPYDKTVQEYQDIQAAQ